VHRVELLRLNDHVVEDVSKECEFIVSAGRGHDALKSPFARPRRLPSTPERMSDAAGDRRTQKGANKSVNPASYRRNIKHLPLRMLNL